MEANQFASLQVMILSTICAGLIAYILGLYADRARNKAKAKQKQPPKVDLDYWEKDIS